jgi:hypothetical protein
MSNDTVQNSPTSEGLPVATSDTYQGNLPKGRARIQFTITDPTPGTYYIYLLNNCGTASLSLGQSCNMSDAYYASVNEIVSPEVPLKHSYLNPTTPLLDPFVWSKLGIIVGSNNFAPTVSGFQLGAGNHEFTIVPREYGFQISKIAITKDANFISNTKLWDKAKLLIYNLDHIYAGLKFIVDVSEFDVSSYLLSKPRFAVPVGKTLRVKNIIASINDGVRTNDTWANIDLTMGSSYACSPNDNQVVAPCIKMIPTSQIILKDKGFELDELSFKFETLTVE